MSDSPVVQKIDPFGTVIIDSFFGEFRFLSNFHPAPIFWKGRKFFTTEHAYQWAKTNDPIEKENVLFAWVEWDMGVGIKQGFTTPGQAKRAGDKVTKRNDWKTYRIQVMQEVLYAKFTQNPELRQMLLATGDAILIEGNVWHDNTWGSCNCPKCGNKGLNMLGSMLMRLRDQLQSVVPPHCCLGSVVVTDDKL